MIEQGTPEWFKLRAGKVTASRVADILAKTKTGVSASRGNYLIQLALEIHLVVFIQAIMQLVATILHMGMTL